MAFCTRDPGSVLVAPPAVAPRYDTEGTMLTASRV